MAQCPPLPRAHVRSFAEAARLLERYGAWVQAHAAAGTLGVVLRFWRRSSRAPSAERHTVALCPLCGRERADYTAWDLRAVLPGVFTLDLGRYAPDDGLQAVLDAPVQEGEVWYCLCEACDRPLSDVEAASVGHHVQQMAAPFVAGRN